MKKILKAIIVLFKTMDNPYYPYIYNWKDIRLHKQLGENEYTYIVDGYKGYFIADNVERIGNDRYHFYSNTETGDKIYSVKTDAYCGIFC